MNRFHRFLRWTRIEDDAGSFSLTFLAFVAGIYCVLAGKAVSLPTLATFALTLGAHSAKRLYQHRAAQKAADTAHEQKLAEVNADHEQVITEMQHAADAKTALISENAEALAAKIAAVESKVKELATPERMDAIRRTFGKG